MNYVRNGNSTWHYGVRSIASFPHVLYKLWLVSVATRHLEVFF